MNLTKRIISTLLALVMVLGAFSALFTVQVSAATTDKEEAKKNIQYMIERLQLAEELEAATCVNILGTKQTANWFGPHADCYSESFFEEAVAVSQHIIDSVKPEHTKLSFEMMPFYFLDGPEDYLRFLSGGCSKSPIDLLKGAGVDMTSPEPVNQALQLFGELLDEMEALMAD